MTLKVVQINLGREWDALYLLHKNMEDTGAGVAIISEPRTIPNTPYWFGSDDGLAAVCWAVCTLAVCLARSATAG